MTTFLVEGTTFKDKDTAIASLVQAATASTKAFRIVDNRDYRYLVCCASHKGDKGWRKNKDICPWFVECKPIRSTLNESGWKIAKMISSHTCNGTDSKRERNYNHGQLRKASKVLKTFIPSKKKSGSTNQLTMMIKNSDGIHINKGQAHKIVQDISQNGVHVHIGQYLLLLSYVQFLQEVDQEGSFEIETGISTWINKEQFKRMYVAFSYVKQFWRKGGCIPLYAVDRTFTTSGKFKQTILFAVSYDANNELVMLAYAICSIENEDNWNWFLTDL